MARTQFDRNLEVRNRYEESICNIYANAARFGWSLDYILQGLKEMRNERAYQKLPGYWQSHLSGFVKAVDKLTFKQFATDVWFYDNKLISDTSVVKDGTWDRVTYLGLAWKSDLNQFISVAKDQEIHFTRTQWAVYHTSTTPKIGNLSI